MMGRPSTQPQLATAKRADYSGTELLNKNAPSRSSNLLLEALKEELFQLESDKIQGHLSQPEYAEARAALDLLIKRAVSRQNQPAKI